MSPVRSSTSRFASRTSPRARAALPEGTSEIFDIGGGIRVTLVEAPTEVEYDLDHVALRTSRPGSDGSCLRAVRLQRRPVPGAWRSAARSSSFTPATRACRSARCSNHLAVLVDSADDVIADAGDSGIEVESVVDAANTYAAFLWGPDRVRIEYVEHKPTFSLT